ncbi:MAG: hypothetical protein IKL70_03300 [Oscillospiraceae bacterium]|nr:hypothetical protein [Oscillospiraceae bacterium]
MIKKILITALAVTTAFFTLASNTVTANASDDLSALEQWTQVTEGTKIEPKGHEVFWGGINKYEGICCENRTDSVLLEEFLQSSGYVLVSSPFKEISDEDYKILKKYGFNYSQYLKDDEYYNTYYRVYIPEVVYEELMTYRREGKSVPMYLSAELDYSTVVVAYDFWDAVENAGTVDYEVNDDIPATQTHTGWMTIETPIPVKVVLHEMTRDRFYELYLSGNEPFDIRLKAGCYVVSSVNDTKIKVNNTEETLPYNNYIWVEDGNTEDNAYKVDLTKLIEKHNIQPADISGQPDLSYYKNQNIPGASEQAVLSDAEENTDKGSILGFVGVGIVIALIGGTVAIVVIKKKKSISKENK